MVLSPRQSIIIIIIIIIIILSDDRQKAWNFKLQVVTGKRPSTVLCPAALLLLLLFYFYLLLLLLLFQKSREIDKFKRRMGSQYVRSEKEATSL